MRCVNLGISGNFACDAWEREQSTIISGFILSVCVTRFHFVQYVFIGREIKWRPVAFSFSLPYFRMRLKAGVRNEFKLIIILRVKIIFCSHTEYTHTYAWFRLPRADACSERSPKMTCLTPHVWKRTETFYLNFIIGEMGSRHERDTRHET